MGKSINDFELELNLYNTEKLKKISKAIKILQGSIVFDKEFKWTGYGIIGSICDGIISRRK